MFALVLFADWIIVSSLIRWGQDNSRSLSVILAPCTNRDKTMDSMLQDNNHVIDSTVACGNLFLLRGTFNHRIYYFNSINEDSYSRLTICLKNRQCQKSCSNSPEPAEFWKFRQLFDLLSTRWISHFCKQLLALDQVVEANALKWTKMLEAVGPASMSKRKCLRAPFSRSRPPIFFRGGSWTASGSHKPATRARTA